MNRGRGVATSRPHFKKNKMDIKEQAQNIINDFAEKINSQIKIYENLIEEQGQTLLINPKYSDLEPIIIERFFIKKDSACYNYNILCFEIEGQKYNFNDYNFYIISKTIK